MNTAIRRRFIINIVIALVFVVSCAPVLCAQPLATFIQNDSTRPFSYTNVDGSFSMSTPGIFIFLQGSLSGVAFGARMDLAGINATAVVGPFGSTLAQGATCTFSFTALDGPAVGQVVLSGSGDPGSGGSFPTIYGLVGTTAATLESDRPEGGFDDGFGLLTIASPYLTFLGNIDFKIGLHALSAPLNTGANPANYASFFGWVSAVLTSDAASVTGLSQFTLSSSVVPGSKSVTGTVTLDQTSATDITVNLTNTNTAATVPASVVIPAGKISLTFTIKTNAVTSTRSGTITASENGLSFSAPLTVRPIAIKSLAITPSSVKGGSSASGTVTLEVPAAGTITVFVASDNVAATPVGPVKIAIGLSSGKFSITTKSLSSSVIATILATTTAGPSATSQLSITP